VSLRQLPQSPRTGVFRAIEKILRTDPLLRNTIEPSSLRAWNGNDDDGIVPTQDMAPFLRMTPINQAETWWTPSSQTGSLLINMEILINGFLVDDLLNFWWAIERAIYPMDYAARMKNIEAIRQAGAMTGLVSFTQPVFDPSPETISFAGVGQLKVEIRLDLNP
jgi:hypothetical protein